MGRIRRRSGPLERTNRNRATRILGRARDIVDRGPLHVVRAQLIGAPGPRPTPRVVDERGSIDTPCDLATRDAHALDDTLGTDDCRLVTVDWGLLTVDGRLATVD